MPRGQNTSKPPREAGRNQGEIQMRLKMHTTGQANARTQRHPSPSLDRLDHSAHLGSTDGETCGLGSMTISRFAAGLTQRRG